MILHQPGTVACSPASLGKKTTKTTPKNYNKSRITNVQVVSETSPKHYVSNLGKPEKQI